MIRFLWIVALGSAWATVAAAAGIGPGGAIYDRYCARCHGFDGSPNLPGSPDFSWGEGLRKSDHELITAIRFGVRAMPGFDQEIDTEGLIDVLYYLRSLQR